MAARIVNKQRAQYGETKSEKKADREGKSPDKDLPIRDYDRLNVTQISGKIKSLSRKELQQIKKYESKHKNRKTLMQKLESAENK